MIARNKTYAVVGASNNREKYGNKVFNDLDSAGYNVIPINNREDQIEGVQAYHSLKDYKGRIDVVIFVVPPLVTESVLKEVHELTIHEVWMQPGSESPAGIAFCEEKGIQCTHNACIMVERKRSQN